ncbi:MAG: phenylalanine--tRNA ligase beta subunit-related protein [Bacteroidales bacterium]|nr:phenylalanine--tRNA ligase beta subunit-related protein [Bacteroidales bacterium]
MKKITISEALKEKASTLQLGILEAKVRVTESPDELVKLLHSEAETIAAREDVADISQLPQVHATREAYKALGKKPARYRVSSEALHRRIVQGKGLYFINNVVDINNLISIQSGCGICLYDADRAGEEITFRIAAAGETYRGIGKYDLNLENLPVFADEQGPFGSPTSDSERTMVSTSTNHILLRDRLLSGG